jgi:hypothetical protein
MAAQKAGIMVGDGGIDHFDGLDTTLLNQVVNEAAVVKHLESASQLRIFVAHGIEAMGTYGDYLGHIVTS